MNNQTMKQIQDTASQLKQNYEEQKLFDMALGDKVPKKDMIISILNDLHKLTFPGYFASENMSYLSKDDFAGYTLSMMAEKLQKQLELAIAYDEKDKDAKEITKIAQEIVIKFTTQIPRIQELIVKDVQAEFDGDPAAKNLEDIIFSYPGIYAIFVYRYAHALYELQVPYIPRIMTEYAHSETGIDINPGAQIGEYFCIDHGTGIVVGETTIIGSHVKIYQGVTLGALSTRAGQALKGSKRHPTIEDNVVIYANTTILGGATVVGENAVVAGNTFVTESIPANSKVASTLPKLEIKTKA